MSANSEFEKKRHTIITKNLQNSPSEFTKG
jgi:hypothetical protein